MLNKNKKNDARDKVREQSNSSLKNSNLILDNVKYFLHIQL